MSWKQIAVFQRLVSRWRGSNLLTRFVVTSSALMLGGMLALGSWMAQRIETGVVNNAAATAALFVNSLVKASVQDLATGPTISRDHEKSLDKLLQPAAGNSQIARLMIWKGDTIVYSTDRNLVGKSFSSTPKRQRAWAGQIEAEYKRLDQPEHAPRLTPHQSLLEIYVPVRLGETNQIIALAEVYHSAPELEADIRSARFGSWLSVGTLAILLAALQGGIVRAGSRTIEQQRSDLDERIGELMRLVDENDVLNRRVTNANARLVEMNERFLRRIGAELRVGPISRVTRSLCQLDALNDAITVAHPSVPSEAQVAVLDLRHTLHDALEELQSVSGGLLAPDIDNLPLEDILDLAAKQHEERTGIAVKLAIGALPSGMSFALKSCLYRFVLEGLAIANKHDSGSGRLIEAKSDGTKVKLTVRTAGGGAGSLPLSLDGGAKQFLEVRDRLEALGGSLAVSSDNSEGTVLHAELDFKAYGTEEGKA